MAPAVDAALADILGEEGRDALRAAGRYRRDVY
jgi:sulfite reductase (NADPH) flavoprotein alpha-component